MTRIYALTDSHQESRNLSQLLSGIYQLEKDKNDKFLILDAGDIFKGIYDKNRDNFLFFNKMRCPVKRIKNKFRYQVLMRLSDTSVLPQIYDVCMQAKNREVVVSVEENPTNLS